MPAEPEMGTVEDWDLECDRPRDVGAQVGDALSAVRLDAERR